MELGICERRVVKIKYNPGFRIETSTIIGIVKELLDSEKVLSPAIEEHEGETYFHNRVRLFSIYCSDIEEIEEKDLYLLWKNLQEKDHKENEDIIFNELEKLREP